MATSARAIAQEAAAEKAADNIRNVQLNGVDVGMGELTAVGTESGTSASEKVTVYSTVDGRESHVFLHQLKGVLKMRLPNGKPMYWVEGMDERDRPPHYQHGTLKCLLHPKHENREMYDQIGLQGRFCNLTDPEKGKANLRSEMDVDAHMRICHRQEYQIIKDNEARIERMKDRERDNLIASALTEALKKDK